MCFNGKNCSAQLATGGNILMIQIENEYGSFGEEKAYLRAIRDLMIARGVTAPFLLLTAMARNIAGRQHD